MRAEAGERPGDGGSPAGPERGGAAGKFRADRNGFPLGWEEQAACLLPSQIQKLPMAPSPGPPIFMELWCGVKGCFPLSSGVRDVSREVCLGAQGEPRCCLWV